MNSKDELKIPKIVSVYRGQLKVTQDKFAILISQNLIDISITRQAISNWESGIDEPKTDFLLDCLVAYTDWRRRWAIECLVAKKPEVFTSGVIKLPQAE